MLECTGHHTASLFIDDEPIFLVSADAEAPSCGSGQNLSNSSDQDQMVTFSNTPPTAVEMVPPDSTSPGPDDAVTQSER